MGKPLFNILDLKKESAPLQTGTAIKTSGNITAIIGDYVAGIKATVGNLQEGDIVNFWTDRNWSVHHMIYYLSEYTGPAQLYMTAWTCGEEPVRILSEMKKEGRITGIHCLMDFRITNRKEEAVHFFNSILDRKAYTKVHAKTFVLIGKERAVCLTGSANLSENVRQEAGVIFCINRVARFNAARILNMIRQCGKKST